MQDLKRAFEPPPLGRRLNFETLNGRGETALMAATERSANASLSYLLSLGSDVNAQVPHLGTCLYHNFLLVPYLSYIYIGTASCLMAYKPDLSLRTPKP